MTHTDQFGVVSTMAVDAARRLTSVSNNTLRLSLHFAGLSPLGLPSQVTLSAPNVQSLTESLSFDSLSRPLSASDRRGSASAFSYSQSGQSEQAVVTFPDGTTLQRRYYNDGSLAAEWGTAVHPSTYTYSYPTGGGTVAYRKTYLDIAAESFTWPATTPYGGRIVTNATVCDMAGRVIQTIAGDGTACHFAYDKNGNVTRTAEDGRKAVLLTYDAAGRRDLAAVDNDGDDAIGAVSSDYVMSNRYAVSVLDGLPAVRVATFVIPETNSAAVAMVAEAVGSLDGTAVALCDARGTQAVLRVARTSADTVVQTVSSPGINGSASARFVNGLLDSVQSREGRLIAVKRDAFQRVNGFDDSVSGPIALGLDNEANIVSVTDSRGRTTSAQYDSVNAVTNITMPDGHKVVQTYYGTGEIKDRYGYGTVATRTLYDGAGNRVALRTSPSLTAPQSLSPAGGMTTSWSNDLRGRLVAKCYPDGMIEHTTWTDAGQVHSKTDGRSNTVTFGYNAACQLVSAQYSDATPGWTTVRDRLGRVRQVSDSAGARVMDYDAADGLTALSGSNSVGQFAYDLAYGYDSLGRRTNMTVRVGASTQTVAYVYDDLGRLSRMSVAQWAAGNGSTQEFTYGWRTNANLVTNLYLAGAGSLRWTYPRNAEHVTSIELWSSSNTMMAAEAYAYDPNGRRTNVVRWPGAVRRSYAYDAGGGMALSVETNTLTGVGVTVGATNAYDGCGNRLFWTEGGTNYTYAATALNQYLAMAAVPVRTSQAPVSVAFAYDRAGNLTNDGTWAYSWDAENRLVMVSNATMIVSNAYDSQSRRVGKSVYVWDVGLSQHVLASQSSYVYDGWNVAAELAYRPAEGRTNVNWFVWGLDLAGQRSGRFDPDSGGVGALLAASFESAASTASVVYAYDGNGNVAHLVSTNGAAAVSYDYAPFGQARTAATNSAICNPFMFSTKYCDPETGLYYFGRRWYTPKLGRWISRDPKQEEGGVNLYAFCGNDPVNNWDPTGLAPRPGGRLGSAAMELLPEEEFRRVAEADPNSGLHRSRAGLESEVEALGRLLGRVRRNPGVPLSLVGRIRAALDAAMRELGSSLRGGGAESVRVEAQSMVRVARNLSGLRQEVTPYLNPSGSLPPLSEAETKAFLEDVKAGRVATDPFGLPQAAKSPSFNSIMRQVETVDVSTPRNGAVFWTGYERGNQAAAMKWAAANGKSTIEMTPGGQWLNSLDLYGVNSPLTRAQADAAWLRMSERFTEGASGHINAFTRGTSFNPASTFYNTELPGLRLNPNVSPTITYHCHPTGV